ncbi:MAG: Sec-independent protein translocase protein TatB [Pseudomonadota bacterium]|nr:Sec-independent protein translocase protein TatB [Pseudomonadota bacterium]|tara:strand:- start:216 stop:569 length:354 start_codon:yes stop_codon:yes gene_type:complete
MFDIAFPELVLVCAVALVVLGPERLPTAIRTLGLWFGRLRRSYYSVKTEIEHEVGMDDIRRQLHDEQIKEEINRLEQDVSDVKTEIDGVVADSIDPVARQLAADAATDDKEGATAGG